MYVKKTKRKRSTVLIPMHGKTHLHRKSVFFLQCVCPTVFCLYMSASLSIQTFDDTKMTKVNDISPHGCVRC